MNICNNKQISIINVNILQILIIHHNFSQQKFFIKQTYDFSHFQTWV